MADATWRTISSHVKGTRKAWAAVRLLSVVSIDAMDSIEAALDEEGCGTTIKALLVEASSRQDNNRRNVQSHNMTTVLNFQDL